MANFEFDPEQLKADQDAALEQKRNLALIGGIGDVLGSAQGFGNFYTGKMNPQATSGARTAAAMSDTIADPIERQGKLYGAYKNSVEAKQLGDDEARRKSEKDPNSKESMALKSIAPRWGIKVTPEMSAYEIKQLINPQKMMETEAAANVDFDKQRRLREIENKAHMDRTMAEIAARGSEARATQAEKKRAISEKQIGDIQQYDDSINSLQDMLNSAKPEYIGAIDGNLPDWTRGGDEAAFRSRVGRYSDAYRKLITGAGASNMELKRLEGRLPGTTDTFENFQAKAKAMLDETKRARERHLGNLERTGKDVADFKAAAPAKTIVNRMINPRTGQSKVIYSDGSEEILNSTAGR